MKYLLLLALTATAATSTIDTVCRGEGCGRFFDHDTQWIDQENRFSSCRPDTILNRYYTERADSVKVYGKTFRTDGPVFVYYTKIEWVCK